MMEENILRKIGGQYISAALQTLPDAETSTVDLQKTVIEVPVFGRVRFLCKRMTGKQGKTAPGSGRLLRRLRWIEEKSPG